MFVGITRFTDLQRDLGIARNVLSARLEHLLDRGILEVRPYQEHPPHHDYLLTEKGGELVEPAVSCPACGERLRSADVKALAGPGGHAGPGTWVMAERLPAR